MSMHPIVIGHYPDGRPVHLIAGGDGDGDQDGSGDGDNGGGAPADGRPADGGVKPKGKPAPAPATPPAPSSGEPPATATPDLAAITRERDLAKRDLGKLQKELADLRAAEKAREDEEKSALERAQESLAAEQKARADSDSRARERALKAATYEAAQRAGFRFVEDALDKLERSKVEFDDDGEPTNVADLVAELATRRKDLLDTGPPPADAGQGTRGEPTLTLEQIRNMSVEEHRARKDEVERALSQHAGR